MSRRGVQDQGLQIAIVLLTVLASAGCAARRPAEGTANIYLPGSAATEAVRYRVVDGMAVYQGDIMLGPVAEVEQRYASPQLLRGPGTGVYGATVMSSGDFRWPGGQVPYVIDDSVGQTERNNIAFAVQRLGTTPLNLRPRTAADRDYIRFVEANECWSYYGRTGGEQKIMIGGCGGGGVIHEVLHAGGFYHEHARPDRDAYVTINWGEISQGHESNFTLQQSAKTIGPYDYESVMHYSGRAFSKSGAPTIIPKNPGQRLSSEDLSPLDIAGIRELYGQGGVVAPTGLPSWFPQVPGLPAPGTGMPPGGLPQLPPPPAGLPFPLPW